ncbi:hypothetical protein SCLCIDRAFT_149873 [Scleroderma citrinum Foug A]|uniref:Uncharacterized protein n=1 Tax=Scleroderma citrinum Foug A TaxID=1036808 RepID=A0A0C3A9L6_9AGAM|nr:hypothetical protein SCLCIDRAFT_149873 [Scleroderma citrinum Foug A]
MYSSVTRTPVGRLFESGQAHETASCPGVSTFKMLSLAGQPVSRKRQFGSPFPTFSSFPSVIRTGHRPASAQTNGRNSKSLVTGHRGDIA